MSTAQRLDLDVVRISPREARPAPDLKDPYRWALNPLQPFGSLLAIAQRLAHAAPAATDALTGDPVTNLYLVACGLDQVLSDYLHRHFYEMDRAGFPLPVRRALGWATTAGGTARRAWSATAGRGLVETEQELARLARSLGRGMIEGRTAATADEAAAISRLGARRYPARLRRSLLKLPQSYRGVDLYPADCLLLAQRAFARGAKGPVAVVGLRTSGLYLAALVAAELDRLGQPSVQLLSLRPGGRTLPAEERRLRAVAATGGWAFVVDDPTWRGSAFAKTFETLKSFGFEDKRLCLAACEIGNQPVFRSGDPAHPDGADREAVWDGFEAAQKVVLGKSEWRIHDHLSNEAAARCLNRPAALARLGASSVRVKRGHSFTETGEPPAIAGLSTRPRLRRFHAQKIYEIEVVRDGLTSNDLVVGRGVGLGFFGYHSYLVAQALDGFTPELLGYQDGVLFTGWESGPPVEAGSLSGRDIEAVGRYIVHRAEVLRLPQVPASVPETRALYSGARQVARNLGRTMGGVGALAQFRMADALSSAFAPERPAAIDARMGPSEWLRDGSGRLVKVDFEEHGVDITDRWVADPVHDVAAAAVALALDAASETQLVEFYAHATGDRDRLPARLAYHKLMAGLEKLDAITSEGSDRRSRAHRERFARDLVATETALTGAVNGYLAALYLAGVRSRGTGDVWALDLDDTLETDWLGFQTTSPAGALALRTLAAHDQLVVVSTGRSLAEVQDRCETFGFAGGIAEYGAVAWDALHRRSVQVITGESRLSLDRLREAILDETDIMADSRYQHSLRLFRHTPGGRRGMKVEEIAEVIDRHRIEGLEVVEGYSKTVVWAAGCDKAHAMEPLFESLGIDRRRRRLHAMGDEFTDLGLMALADCRHAPGNATAAVRERSAELRIKFAKRGRGAGVREAALRELHRATTSCPVCGEVAFDWADRVLVQALGVQDRSRLGRFAYALHPASIRAFEL